MPHEDAYTGKRHNSPVRLWVMINCIMGGFFALAGLVQFRDPAPIMWMVIYFVPSFLCFAIVYSPDVTDKLWWKIVFLIHFMCISIKQVFLGTQLIFWMKDRVINPLRYAEGREFFGIIIVQVWLLVCKCGGNIKGGSTSRTTAVTWCILFLGFFPFTFWFLLCVSQFNHCSDMWWIKLEHGSTTTGCNEGCSLCERMQLETSWMIEEEDLWAESKMKRNRVVLFVSLYQIWREKVLRWYSGIVLYSLVLTKYYYEDGHCRIFHGGIVFLYTCV